MKKKYLFIAVGLVLLAALLMVNTGEATGAITTITRISGTLDGSELARNGSYNPSISSDGRYVAFEADAWYLINGVTSYGTQVYLNDTQTGITSLVAQNSNGVKGNSDSSQASVSSNGQLVAFASFADNLVDGDTNGITDIFVKNVQTGAVSRVSVSSDGTQANDSSFLPKISANGQYVAFESYASNLVAGDDNAKCDIFVHNMLTGSTTRISADSKGEESSDTSMSSSISSDGRYIAFQSNGNNLVDDDTNNAADIFVHDTVTGITSRVSVDSAGVQGNDGSYYPSISADGRFIAFESNASNLVSDDPNGMADIFVHDIQTGSTTLVSKSSEGQFGNNYSGEASISGNGRFVTFTSYASNLVADDTNNAQDVFIHDTLTGITARLSVTYLGGQGGTDPWGSWISLFSRASSLSSDGQFVTFESAATNLVANDKDQYSDIFIIPATIYGLTVQSGGNGNGTIYNTYISPASITVSSAASITCDSLCTYYFPSGTTFGLQAQADPGFVFKHWEGDLTGTHNPVPFVLNSNMSITAIFGDPWRLYLPLIVR